MEETLPTREQERQSHRLQSFLSDFLRQDRELSSLPLEAIIATGGSGIILGNGTQVIKLALKKPSDFFEYDLNYWASQTKFGPKFYSWGQVILNQTTYEVLYEFASKYSQRKRPPISWPKVLGDKAIFYSVFDKWQLNLNQYFIDRGLDFKQIPLKCGQKLDAARTALLDLGVIHHDFLPKNILVRVGSSNNILDVCLTDFGNAILETDWYYAPKTMKSRMNYVNYFMSDSTLKQTLLDLFDGSTEKVQFFLLNEVRNFDLALLLCYNYRTNRMQLEPPEMPPPFNFQLPWNSDGSLNTICVNYQGSVRYFCGILGNIPLSELRQELERQKIYVQYFKSYLGKIELSFEYRTKVATVLYLKYGKVFLNFE